MPDFFFHTQDGYLVLDNVGSSLASLEAAKVEAVRLLGSLIADRAEDFLADGTMKLMVTNPAGVMLFALELSAVEPPMLKPRLVREFL